jgi:hypothetical protein
MIFIPLLPASAVSVSAALADAFRRYRNGRAVAKMLEMVMARIPDSKKSDDGRYFG